MAKAASFQETQFQFTAYIRDPSTASVPDNIEKRRMDLYRELILNNLENFLSNHFPVLWQLMDESSWGELVQDFFSRHRCSTPYFSKIAEEFLQFLQDERNEKSDFPFLLELAHYEWVESALMLALDDDSVSSCRSSKPVDLDQVYRNSDLAWRLVYRYPVHRISTSYQPEQAPENPTYLIVYRNPEYEVKFMEINAATYRLLEILDRNPEMTAKACLIQLSSEMAGMEASKMVEFGAEILKACSERSLLYPL